MKLDGDHEENLATPLLLCEDEEDEFFDTVDDGMYVDVPHVTSSEGHASRGHGAGGPDVVCSLSTGSNPDIHAETCSRVNCSTCQSTFQDGEHPASCSAPAVPGPDRVAVPQYDFLLHRAAFDGNVSLLRDVLEQLPRERWLELDPQGQSALHLAVLRGQLEAIEALLEVGFKPTLENRRGWTALEEAVDRRSRAAASLLLQAETLAVKLELKAKKHLLLQQMQDLPDYSFKLKWELGSPVFGLLLRKVAPHDTYEVWKKGTRIRVDGTLKGIEENSSSIIPEWKRGHFSLLFDGATTPNTILLLDNVRRSYVDLARERQEGKADLDAQVSMVMTDGGGKAKMKSSEFKFKPVKGWLGGDATEKIEGWKTRLYEATGKMKVVSIEKGSINIPKDATFEEYLDMSFPEDEVSEQMIDPLSITGPSPFSTKGVVPPPDGEVPNKKGRLLTGRCWMAEDFPMSLRQLLPVLDIIGNANKHIARVGKFLQKYGELELFPVKLQVPLLFTIYALISFCKFKELQPGEHAYDDVFYQLPSDYRLKTIDECRQGKGW